MKKAATNAIKPFATPDDYEFASLTLFGSESGPMRIDVASEPMTAKQARRLAIWLMTAAEITQDYNRHRRKKGSRDTK